MKVGDYVVATKYVDGDPRDQFAIGFYEGCFDHGGQRRHLVNDADGKPFRYSGFRRAARIGARRGTWMVNHLSLIEQCADRWSVWHWVRAPWKELSASGAPVE